MFACLRIIPLLIAVLYLYLVQPPPLCLGSVINNVDFLEKTGGLRSEACQQEIQIQVNKATYHLYQASAT